MSNLTVEQYRQWQNAPTEPATSVIQAAINAIEEQVAIDTGRTFTTASTASARVYAAREHTSTLAIHDCTTVTAVSNDGATVPPASYQLQPVNGITVSGQVTPYTHIHLLDGALWAHRGRDAIITVTATWGWPSGPSRYTEACKILVADLLSHKDLRNGLVGFSDMAVGVVRENRSAQRLLRQLTRFDPFGLDW